MNLLKRPGGLVAVAAAVAAVAVLIWWLATPDPTTATTPNAANPTSAAPVSTASMPNATPASGDGSAPVAPVGPSAQPATAPAAAPLPPASAAPPAVVSGLAQRPSHQALGLTRPLGGANDEFVLDNRRTVVWGSKPDANVPGANVVALVDSPTGQVNFVGEGLHVTLVPSADARAFLAGYSGEQVLVATVMGIELRIDAGRLAAEYTKLKADPRVASVRFSNAPTVLKPQ